MMSVATTVSMEMSIGSETTVGIDAPGDIEDVDAVTRDVRAVCSCAE